VSTLNVLIDRAVSTALKRPAVRQFLVGAAALRSDGAIVCSRNEASVVPTPGAHAEARLVRKLGRDAKMIVVVRISKDTGSLVMAKPCSTCAAILKSYRVEKIFYSTENGMEEG